MIIKVTKKQLADIITGLEIWKSEYEGTSEWREEGARVIRLIVKLEKYDK